jgi:DNA-binding NarL/FixJ family response regulator
MVLSTSDPDGAPVGEPIRVLVVDDHHLFAESVSRVLNEEGDIVVVGQSGTSAAAVGSAQQLQPDVALVDYRLPDSDGVATALAIREVSPATRVLILTGMTDERILTDAIEAGCAGFLTKDNAIWELVAAVHLVHSGEAYLSPGALAALLPRLRKDHRNIGSDLTVREHEVLQLMSSGAGNKDIAGLLNLSLNTIRNHVQNVLVTLGAHSKLEAVAIAAREGLVDRRQGDRRADTRGRPAAG